MSVEYLRLAMVCLNQSTRPMPLDELHIGLTGNGFCEIWGVGRHSTESPTCGRTSPVSDQSSPKLHPAGLDSDRINPNIGFDEDGFNKM